MFVIDTTLKIYENFPNGIIYLFCCVLCVQVSLGERIWNQIRSSAVYNVITVHQFRRILFLRLASLRVFGVANLFGRSNVVSFGCGDVSIEPICSKVTFFAPTCPDCSGKAVGVAFKMDSFKTETPGKFSLFLVWIWKNVEKYSNVRVVCNQY